MDNPKVSILTPSYNQTAWLADNLRSVQQQAYPNVEHVVMDGGSTDGSLKLLENSGSNVRWWSEPDRGQSHALNKAFAESQGEIIGWLNSDDAYVDRRSIQSAVEIFDCFPEVGVVFGHGLLVNRNNRVLQYLWAPSFSQSLLPIGTFFVQPSVFMRRAALKEPLVNEDLQFVMDRDLWLRLAKNTVFRRIDIVVGLDRHQPDRKTLQSSYPTERIAYERSRGINSGSRSRAAIVRSCKIAARLRGAASVPTLSSRIDSAIDLNFGNVRVRLVNQVATKRRNMLVD